MLYVIGLGLADERDITVKGLEAVKRSSKVYLEAYTSILMCDVKKLEEFYGKSVIVADRDLVETQSDDILSTAAVEDVSFLVVGDPLGATTHTDLIIRARSLTPPVPYRIIHNASIMNAIGCSGLQLYNFGQTVSVPFYTDSWRPHSWYPRVRENVQLGMHTLVLGDIKVKEQSEENMARGRKIFEPPRYMLVPTLIDQMLQAEADQGDGTLSADRTLAIAVCRVGASDQRILAGTLGELLALDRSTGANSTDKKEGEVEEEEDEDEDDDSLPRDAATRASILALRRAYQDPSYPFGPPLHSLLLVGRRLHPLESDFAQAFAVEGSRWAEVARDVYGCKE